MQGAPGGGGNPGVGWGDTYNFSAGATYTAGSNVVMDGHFGWVRMGSNVEMSDLGENKGLDWLGIPGTNGPDPWDGGTPFFDLDGYADLGTTQNFMPYYRNDDQYQMVANVTWLKGRHNIRFGSDRLLHGPESYPAGDPRRRTSARRGGWNFNVGPDPAARRPRRHQLQQLRLVSPRSPVGGRTPEAERGALHDAELAVQLLRARSVAGPAQR